MGKPAASAQTFFISSSYSGMVTEFLLRVAAIPKRTKKGVISVASSDGLPAGKISSQGKKPRFLAEWHFPAKPSGVGSKRVIPAGLCPRLRVATSSEWLIDGRPEDNGTSRDYHSRDLWERQTGFKSVRSWIRGRQTITTTAVGSSPSRPDG